MRAYADLHLLPPPDDAANAQAMADILLELRTSTIGLVLPPERLERMPAAYSVFRSAGIDVATRLNLKPKSKNDLLRDLRKHRNAYEIIAVQCDSSPISQVAVRDRRVDIVRFPRTMGAKLFHLRLARICRAALEIDMTELTSRINSPATLFGLLRNIQIAVEASIPVIGSTGASKPLNLRSPRDIASILHVIGLPINSALDSVSAVPVGIVQKNRLKLGQSQPEDGVRILRS